jgi:pimeloyl-ACP methyl ester carboxylesterase
MNYSTRYDAGSIKQVVRTRGSLLRRRGPMLVGTGVALAAMALFVQSRSRQAERENPPTGKFIEVDGVRLHYIERGQGQPVVLLHGNGTMMQDFDISGVPGLAADKYRVIAFDRPGYGYSDRPRSTIWDPVAQAELLYKALQQLNVEHPVIVGHSWGTLVAVALGLEHPEYVASIVLLSGYYYPTPRLDVALLSPPAIPVIGDLMRYTVSPLIGRLIWPAMLRKIFGPAKTPGRYKELTMPVVIMSGAADRHVLAKLHSERLHRELPQSELHLVPEVGHMIQHEAPLQVMAAIDAAAKAILPGRGAAVGEPAVAG